MLNETDTQFGNTQDRTCFLVEEIESGYIFSCTDHPYMDAVLTFLFIYLPSLYTINTLLGQETAGILGKVWGYVLMGVGYIMAFGLSSINNLTSATLGWMFFLMGVYLIVQGNLQLASCKSTSTPIENVKLFLSIRSLFFLILLPVSPAIYIFIKLLAVLKPKNEFIQKQIKNVSRAEVILEASPQLILQVKTCLLKMYTTDTRLVSMVTSGLSLCLPIIEQYAYDRSEKFCPSYIIKNIFAFLPLSMYKLFCVSILGLFFKMWCLLFLAVIWILMAICLRITAKCYNMEKEVDFDNQFFESCLFSWVTITNLGCSKVALVHRMYSSLYLVIFQSLIMTVILIICNKDPAMVVIDLAGTSGDIIWPDLLLLRDIDNLNLVLGVTITFGWLCFFLDFFIAWLKFMNNDDKLLDNALLLQGLKYGCGSD